MEAIRPSRPEQINQGARHTLFVEGSFDADVLSTFFEAHPLGDKLLYVVPFGPSFSTRAAAQALHRHHPEYYFLIDRDHCDDGEVERSWASFPDPATHNILIWRRRELENYFLIPEYLLGSRHLAVDEARLRACIRDACQQRLYLDAVNHVLTGLREGFKQAWIKLLEKPGEISCRDVALQRLHGLDALRARSDAFAAAITPDALTRRLDEVLAELTGGQPSLADDHGNWRERLRGKHVLRAVIAACFRVRSAQGEFLQGYVREREVARALVKRPLDEQPADLRALHELLRTRIGATSP